MKTFFLLLMLASAANASAQNNEDSLRRKIIDTAIKYKGVPYVYGAESPRAFDCSGFVRYVYREATGLELPRSSRNYVTIGSRIDAHSAKPGDIFIFDTVGGAPSHVALYAGNDRFIHAVSDGRLTGVIESPITDRYWAPKVISVRTVLPAALSVAPTSAAPAVPATPPTTVRPSTGSVPGSLKVVTGDGAIADIGLVIPASKQTSEDAIPAAPGTGMAFTLTNGSGKSGTFIVIFYRIDPRTYQGTEIHQEKINLASGKALNLPAFRFDEPGKYRLIVKDNWNTQLLERTFTVIGR
jgi:hypothetical protein